MLNIDVADSIHCDGLLVDENKKLLFMSAWGRDTAIAEWLAKLTLPGHENGVREFVASNQEHRQYVSVPKELDKRQARMPGSVFGDLIQLFLFDPSLIKPDRVKRQAWLLYRPEDMNAGLRPDIWPLVRETCHVPLQDHWRAPVLRQFDERGWLSQLDGYNVHAIGVDLGSDEVETCIEELVIQRVLLLNDEPVN